MKELDLVLQKMGLAICSLVILVSFVEEAFILLLAYLLLLLAFYQVLHFGCFTLHIIAKGQAPALELLVYPAAILVFLASWHFGSGLVDNEPSIRLYAMHALSIAAYYTYTIENYHLTKK